MLPLRPVLKMCLQYKPKAIKTTQSNKKITSEYEKGHSSEELPFCGVQGHFD